MPTDDKELTPAEIILYAPVRDRIRDLIAKQSDKYTPGLIATLKDLWQRGFVEDGMPIQEATAAAESKALELRDSETEFRRAEVSIQDVHQLVLDMIRSVDSMLIPERGYELTDKEADNLEIMFAATFLMDLALLTPREVAVLENLDIYTSTDIMQALNVSRNDLQEEVIRFPTAFTREQKLGIAGQQFQEAGIITAAERAYSDVWFNNLIENFDQFEAALDTVSTETEKNFANIVDKLVNKATGPERTPEQRADKAQYGGWEFINDPKMVPPNQWSDNYILEQESGEELEELQKTYIEDIAETFKKQIDELYPDDLLPNDEAKNEKKRLIAEGQLQLRQNVNNANPALGPQTTILVNRQIIADLARQAESRISQSGQQGLIQQAEKERQTSLEKVNTGGKAKTAVTNFLEQWHGVDTEIPDYAKTIMADKLLKSYTVASAFGMGAPDHDEVLSQYDEFIPNWRQRAATDTDEVARNVLGIGGFTPGDPELSGRLDESVESISKGISQRLEGDPFSGMLAQDEGANFMQILGLSPTGTLGILPQPTGLTSPDFFSGMSGEPGYVSPGAPGIGSYPEAVQALAGYDPVQSIMQQYDPSRPPMPGAGFFTAGQGIEGIGGRGVIPIRDYAGELGPMLEQMLAGQEPTPEFLQFISQPDILNNLLEQYRQSQQIQREEDRYTEEGERIPGGVMGAVGAERAAVERPEDDPMLQTQNKARAAKGLPPITVTPGARPTQYGAASAAWGDLRRAEMPTAQSFLEKELPKLQSSYQGTQFYQQEQGRLAEEREMEEAIQQREAAMAQSQRRGELRPGAMSIFGRRVA